MDSTQLYPLLFIRVLHLWRVGFSIGSLMISTAQNAWLNACIWRSRMPYEEVHRVQCARMLHHLPNSSDCTTFSLLTLTNSIALTQQPRSYFIGFKVETRERGSTVCYSPTTGFQAGITRYEEVHCIWGSQLHLPFHRAIMAFMWARHLGHIPEWQIVQ